MASIGQRGAAVRSRDTGLYVKADEFSKFLREFHDILERKVEMKKIVDHEMGRVLNKALQLTNKADEDLIRKKWKGKRAITLLGKRIYLTNFKTGRPRYLPTQLWNAVESARKTGLERTLARVGASKASWYAIALKLGQDITGKSWYNKVMIPGGMDRFAVVERKGEGMNYGVTVTNKFAVASFRPADGRRALFAAFAGRMGFYTKNLSEGTFDSIEKIAKKYKGIFLNK